MIEGLLRLQAAGLRLAIVTNQQGIGLGYYTVQDFIAVNQRLLRELGGHGIRISKIYFCPHSLDEQCSCRKPATGMITRAMRDFGDAAGADLRDRRFGRRYAGGQAMPAAKPR